MSQNRTREDFIRFLDYLGVKGLIPSGTASSRRATANKVTSVLLDNEAEDVTSIDLDEVMRRFDNLHPHQYTPESLQTYKSRMKTALEDFAAYCENPLNFKPSGQGRVKSRSAAEKTKPQPSSIKDPLPNSAQSLALPNVSVLPVPLRAGLTIQIAGLPFDLTPSEAKKIANIVLAHAMPE